VVRDCNSHISILETNSKNPPQKTNPRTQNSLFRSPTAPTSFFVVTPRYVLHIELGWLNQLLEGEWQGDFQTSRLRTILDLDKEEKENNSTKASDGAAGGGGVKQLSKDQAGGVKAVKADEKVEEKAIRGFFPWAQSGICHHLVR